MIVRAYKLLNGIDVICELVNDDEGNVIWKEPMVATTQRLPNGKASVNVSPLMNLSDDKHCKPNLDLVVIEYEPNQGFKELYERSIREYQMQRSGLVTPSQQDIERVKGH